MNIPKSDNAECIAECGHLTRFWLTAHASEPETCSICVIIRLREQLHLAMKKTVDNKQKKLTARAILRDGNCFPVTVLAVVGFHAMVRRPGCMAFVCDSRKLTYEN